MPSFPFLQLSSQLCSLAPFNWKGTLQHYQWSLNSQLFSPSSSLTLLQPLILSITLCFLVLFPLVWPLFSLFCWIFIHITPTNWGYPPRLAFGTASLYIVSLGTLSSFRRFNYDLYANDSQIYLSDLTYPLSSRLASPTVHLLSWARYLLDILYSTYPNPNLSFLPNLPLLLTSLWLWKILPFFQACS